uniref:Uncharacterized protein n=1 Tax=Romanomermis culicivorax TaxID=13658 RepID=A0A915HX45_ROMCU
MTGLIAYWEPLQTFNIRGILLCKKGEPFPANKDIWLVQAGHAWVSFSSIIGRSLNEDQQKTFKIEGFLSCQNGEPFPANKEIYLGQTAFYTESFVAKVVSLFIK